MTGAPENPTPEQQSAAEPETVSAEGPADGYWYQPPPVWVARGGAQPQTAQYAQVQQPPRKGNGSAVASLIVSCSSLAFLLFTAGLAAPLTLIASSVSIFLGHKGKADFDSGKADSQRDVSIAGFWTGITGVVLSVVALIAWVVVIVVAIAADDSNSVQDWHREFNWE